MSVFDPQILDLYDKIILVDEPETSGVKESKKNENPLIFKGGNGKRLLFLYHEPDELQDKDREMIGNLIEKAMLYSWDDVALLNLFANNTPDAGRLLDELNPLYVVFWGCVDYAQAAGFNAGLYTTGELSGVKYVCVHSINSYHDDKELKLKLWTSLKALLGI